MWPVVLFTFSFKIWPSDLLSDHTGPSYKLVQDVMQTHILNKFGESWIKTVASSAFTSKLLTPNERRTTNDGVSEKLTLSTLCSGGPNQKHQESMISKSWLYTFSKPLKLKQKQLTIFENIYDLWAFKRFTCALGQDYVWKYGFHYCNFYIAWRKIYSQYDSATYRQ